MRRAPPGPTHPERWPQSHSRRVSVPTRHHRGSKSSDEVEARLCTGDPNRTPITLRIEGVAIHREDVDVPEILFAGSVCVVTAIPPEPYDAGDIGENQTAVRVAVLLARPG